MSPQLLDQQISEITLQILAMITGRPGRLQAVTLGAPQGVAPQVIESRLLERLGAELRRSIAVHVDRGDHERLELLSLEFSWSR